MLYPFFFSLSAAQNGPSRQEEEEGRKKEKKIHIERKPLQFYRLVYFWGKRRKEMTKKPSKWSKNIVHCVNKRTKKTKKKVTVSRKGKREEKRRERISKIQLQSAKYFFHRRAQLLRQYPAHELCTRVYKSVLCRTKKRGSKCNSRRHIEREEEEEEETHQQSI